MKRKREQVSQSGLKQSSLLSFFKQTTTSVKHPTVPTDCPPQDEDLILATPRTPPVKPNIKRCDVTPKSSTSVKPHCKVTAADDDVIPASPRTRVPRVASISRLSSSMKKLPPIFKVAKPAPLNAVENLNGMTGKGTQKRSPDKENSSKGEVSPVELSSPSSAVKLNLSNSADVENNEPARAATAHSITKELEKREETADAKSSQCEYVDDMAGFAEEFDSAFQETPNGAAAAQQAGVVAGSEVDSAVCELPDLEELDGSEWWPWSQGASLDLSAGVRCVVTAVQHGAAEARVAVKGEGGTATATVLLRDMWAYLEVSVGETVGVKGVKEVSCSSSEWIVSSAAGWISVHPDVLITSTQLVGSMFCRRRGVLAPLFKGLEPNNKVMVLGNVVHELFQLALQATTPTELSLQQQLREIVSMPSALRMLYSCGSSSDDAIMEAQPYIPRILDFVRTYVGPPLNEGEACGEELPLHGFHGRISRVVAVEDNLTSRLVGLKGRVDVTVDVQYSGAHAGRTGKVPLELKTGRASHSAEHRAQVVVYTLIMSAQGEETDSGLLVYLRDGVTSLVTVTHAEVRDVILLRNQLVRYTRHWEPGNLPPPLRLPSACKQCPYNAVCVALADDSVGETHPVRTSVEPLPTPHVQYFNKWTRLLAMENVAGAEPCAGAGPSQPTLMPGHVKGEGRPEREDASSKENLPEASLPSSYQTLMMVRSLSGLGLLLRPQHDRLRRLLAEGRTCSTEPAAAQVLPSVVQNPHVIAALAPLNEEQQRAVLMAVSCEQYMLIEGPPGTGKTHTIAALIQVLVALGQTVLLAAHTHSAVDNVLVKLIQNQTGVRLLRLGQLASIDERVHAHAYCHLVENARTVGDVEYLLTAPVVASTCLGLDADLILRRQFDVCIIDEASQVVQAEAVRTLVCCARWVLVGDAHQLGPVVRSRAAVREGMAVSPFELLQPTSSVTQGELHADRHAQAQPENGREPSVAAEDVVDDDVRSPRSHAHVTSLTKQYRMNDVIMGLANRLTYQGRLECGSRDVGVATLTPAPTPALSWCKQLLSSSLDMSVTWLDTCPGPLDPAYTCSNPAEVALVKDIVDQLEQSGACKGSDIGVMAPYRAQIELLKVALPSHVQVSTVDQYQGRDKRCVVISCTRQGVVRSGGSGGELLDDRRRVNVAVTRARHKVVVVGDVRTARQYAPLADLLNALPPKSIIKLDNTRT